MAYAQVLGHIQEPRMKSMPPPHSYRAALRAAGIANACIFCCIYLQMRATVGNTTVHRR